ncbi:hypothetical protein [Streptomyces sp. NPDC056192]|uniref:hypothetical protein n=1 Tax=Streptomyces sp. NPDC056192 TaxID=3345743 RepID=UPI0035E0198F
MSAPTETTYLVWYCKRPRCGKACKIQPPGIEPECRCENPVPGLRPTRVTQMHAEKPRPLQALSDEEGRLRALARNNKRVLVTYEAQIAEAWTSTGRDGLKHVQFIVTTPDGRRHAIDPALPGLHIEAAPAATEESPR